jgi:hypothetical protein
LDAVLNALRANVGWRDTFDNLPDIDPEEFTKVGFVVKSRGTRRSSS